MTNTSIIRLLPQNLINQIAAGEVVERPASAIKELIENAIDAGASRIDVKIQEGGKTYFSVTDNGKGMNKDELKICVERHATSKLPDDDLFHISFLGFRGEALPSIASVAKLSITSRPKDSSEAWRILVKETDFSPTPAPFGTTVEVRDLFFATPARLKFLKSNLSETTAVKDIIQRLAMAYPNIHFSLSDERRVILNYAPVQSLLMRVSQVISKSFDENALPIDADYEGTKLTGFVGLPTYTRSTSQDQYLFVNGRFVKDKVLIGAIRGAFQGLISHDAHPVLALFLSVPPQEVDVNVHPAKTEVRFSNAAKIRGLLVSSIRNVLAENGHRTNSAIGIGALEKSIANTVNIAKLTPFKRSNFTSHPINNEQTPTFLEEKESLFYPEISHETHAEKDISFHNILQSPVQEKIQFSEPIYSVKTTKLEDTPIVASTEDDFPPLGFAKAQLHKTYIVSQTKDSIIITDQHAAHERLTYEKLIKNKELLQGQLLLMPEIIDLESEQADILLSRAQELNAFGFVIEPFGTSTIIVREIPAIFSKTDIPQLIKDLAETVKEFEDTVILEDKLKDICARMACHGSVRAGRVLTVDEMNALLRQMENCGTSGQCIHGRPTYIELKLNEIERLFGRSK